MNTPNEQNASPSSENPAGRNPDAGLNNSEPQFTIPGPLPEAGPATQEILHLAGHKAGFIGPINQVAAIIPPVAAMGDDDVMSQPQKQS